jgi:hypothetical protein
LAIGVPHPDYLNEVLNSKQLREWEIVYSLEPFGEYTEYLRTGIVASTLINLQLKKDSKKVSPFDFIPEVYTGEKSKEKQSVEDMKELLSSMSSEKVKRNG